MKVEEIGRGGRRTKRLSIMLIIMLIIGGYVPFFTAAETSEGNVSTSPQITTDKNIYYIGENIQVTYAGIDSPGGPKFYKIYITNLSNPSSGFVFQQEMMIEPAIWDPQYGTTTIIWNQTYQIFKEIGGQVALGKYYAWYDWVHDKFGPAEFEIAEDSSESSVKVTTDKNTYHIGEPVKITIDGILDDYVFTSEPSILITNKTGNNVFESLIQCIPRDPWISLPYTWIWDQKYKLYDNRGYGLGKEIPPSGEQVPPGKYYAWFDYDGVNKVGPTEFEITKRGFMAKIDIDPDTLNLKSKGKWITCYINLPNGYDVNDIDLSTVILEDTILAGWGDVLGETLMVKFDRSEVEDMLSPGTYNLKVTGELTDGTVFEGYSDEIRIIDPPK